MAGEGEYDGTDEHLAHEIVEIKKDLAKYNGCERKIN